MKTLLAALAITVFAIIPQSTQPAYANQRSLIDNLELCTDISIRYALMVVVARQSKDYAEYRELLISTVMSNDNLSPKEKRILIEVGALAWKHRNGDARADAMTVYRECFKQTGNII
jgi:hypothetical protein